MHGTIGASGHGARAFLFCLVHSMPRREAEEAGGGMKRVARRGSWQARAYAVPKTDPARRFP